MHRASTKDEDVAFMNKLLESNYAALLRFARLGLPDEDMKVVDDIVLRTFKEAWENLDMLRTYHNQRGWLMLAVRNRVKVYNQDVESKKNKRQ